MLFKSLSATLVGGWCRRRWVAIFSTSDLWYWHLPLVILAKMKAFEDWKILNQQRLSKSLSKEHIKRSGKSSVKVPSNYGWDVLIKCLLKWQLSEFHNDMLFPASGQCHIRERVDWQRRLRICVTYCLEGNPHGLGGLLVRILSSPLWCLCQHRWKTIIRVRMTMLI